MVRSSRGMQAAKDERYYYTLVREPKCSVSQGGRLKEYKEFLQIISAIDPNSECNLGVDDLDSTPPQNASLKM